MTNSAPSSLRTAPFPLATAPLVAAPMVVALVLAAFTLPAQAQGTPEQREACAPDAIRLCSYTIPDIPKTTACMKEHAADLSPRCHAVFAAGTEAPPAAEPPREPRKKRVARQPPPERRYEQEPPDRRVARGAPLPDDDEEPGAPPDRFRYGPRDAEDDGYGEDLNRARAVIGRLCEDDVIDPRTCDVTERALSQAR